MDWWELGLIAAASVHLGFQATVTLLVYPALVESGRRGDADWSQVHQAHSRRITPLVVVVYGALLIPVAAAAWRLVVDGFDGGLALAVTGAGVAFAATAFVAAPAHAKLAQGWFPEVAQRLVRADLVRLVGAVTCATGAAVAIG